MIPPYSRSTFAHRRRIRRLVRTAVLAAVLLLLVVFVFLKPFGIGAGIRAIGGIGSKKVGTNGGRPATTATPTPTGAGSSLAPVVPVTSTLSAATAPTLKVSAMAKGLGAAVSRAVAVADGQTILVLGGLVGGSSSASVRRFSPASDTVTAAGTLAVATHDAAATSFGPNAVVFGGGEAVTIDKVQSFASQGAQVIGKLPQPRSDLAVATIGDRTYVLGGYDGKSDQTDVLVTTDGVSYKVVTQLPTPVRYAGVAAVGTTIYLVGGEHNGAQVSQIQAVDVAAGTAKVVSNLPVALSHESVFVLGGTIFMAGGRSGGAVRNQVDVIDLPTGGLTRAGLLPKAAADMALGQNGGDVYLFGGESPTPLSSIVHIGIA
ncbi:MAG: Kelch repeat-containing protein [Actinobacteria bacterium]|nr:Kelch repeat-containing protein [Actinomycetota bacterium]